MSAAAPPLAADLEAGLRRLKLASMRRLAPELLQTAKTQRWAPEELLRTPVEAECAARDEADRRSHAPGGLPRQKRLEDFRLDESSVPRPTFDYLASLEWLPARENVCLLGPAGTGKSHCETGGDADELSASGRRDEHDPKSHWPGGSALAQDLSARPDGRPKHRELT